MKVIYIFLMIFHIRINIHIFTYYSSQNIINAKNVTFIC